MNAAVVVNGRSRDLGAVGGHVTLLEWLRAGGLTGAKEGCAEGECGACSVLVARDDGAGGTRWVAINACLVPAAAFDQQEVVTAEGLGQPGDLHPVQEEMARRGGSQCGYCTPGFICSMAAEYYRPGRLPAASNGHPGQGDPEHGPNGFDLHALSGNLCRCTGYRPIRDAAYALGEPDPADPLLARQTAPPPAAGTTSVTSDQGRYVRPAGLAQALALLAEHPDAQLVAGSTDWGVELNIRHRRAGLTIGIDRIPELRRFSVEPDHIDIGAALTLSEAEARLAGRVPLLDDLFPQFASRLIRNGATFGGNLGTASPIGDIPPVLLALDASLVLASASGDREVPLAGYFTGYRQSVRQPGELIRTIRIPRPVAPVTGFHKIAKRRFDDISSVAVAYALRLDQHHRVVSARIGLGGVAATPLRALAAEEALTGRPLAREIVTEAAERMAEAGTPMTDHRASSAYRTAMLRSSLLKFHAEHQEVHP
ncbi:MAG TPA: FAD binding domain-containing protein [Streptosporangiaceae bacterium]|jgi:xanthine dehydrogenase small subunit|nr:FAD binding domain-containing protein [Streptosporangiaceae bacterium]